MLGNTQMMSQSVDERSAEMSMSGMHDHSSLLVDDKDVVVLMDYIQRNVLRKDLKSPPLIWHHERHHITGTDYIVCLDNLVIDSYVILLDGELDPVTRSILHMGCEIFVNSHRRLALVYIEAEMLEHLLLLVFSRDIFS